MKMLEHDKHHVKFQGTRFELDELYIVMRPDIERNMWHLTVPQLLAFAYLLGMYHTTELRGYHGRAKLAEVQNG